MKVMKQTAKQTWMGHTTYYITREFKKRKIVPIGQDFKL
jgi:hypothetical protein